MGKLIRAKFSDLKFRIIKKTVKRNKTKVCNETTQKLKRKLPSIEDNESPILSKIPKKSLDEPISDPLSEVLEEVYSDDWSNWLNQTVIADDIVWAEKRENSNEVYLKLKDKKSDDLFCEDEIRNSYVNYIYKNFHFYIIDEISLEGLDGITLEALWKRFLMAVEQPLDINDNLKEDIWKLICSNRCFQFFELPDPRRPLEIYNRFNYIDPDIGVVMELAYELPDIYPHAMVNHPHIQGSCSTFNTRVDISDSIKSMSFKEVQKNYGTKMVIVANQNVRKMALCSELVDPLRELQPLEYCVLERIGRSRKLGELTQGNMSLTSTFKIDSQSMFHYKKQLTQHNFISKQFYYIKSAITDQNKTGRLLHLRRFFHNIKSKQLLIAEQIISILKNQPDYRMECTELKKMFSGNLAALLKVIKSQEFRKLVKTDVFYPYRTLYPNAKRSEYMKKAKPEEKVIRCFELFDPYWNISGKWFSEQDDSDDEDEEEGNADLSGSKIYNMELSREVYNYILAKGREGISMQDLIKIIGVDSNTVRMAIKKLVGKNIVDFKKCDRGRQRLILYYPAYLDDGNTIEPLYSVLPQTINKGVSKIKAKMKERQRAAIEKSSKLQYSSNEINQKREGNINPYQNVQEFRRSELLTYNCKHFLKNYVESSEFVDENSKAEFPNITKDYSIQITYRIFNVVRIYVINTILDQITPFVISSSVKVNFENSYVATHSDNHVTKLILLKAVLGDIEINSDTLNLLSRKGKPPAEVTFPKLLENTGGKDAGTLKRIKGKLEFMGTNPQVVFHEKEGNLDVKILVSTPPAEINLSKEYPKGKDMTERVAKRIKFILNIVHEMKICEDLYNLLKNVIEEEAKEGYEKKIDRKSLARIITRLVEGGYIKVYQLILCNGKIKKTMSFVCHPTVSHTDSMIESAAQQLKWKYFVGTSKKCTKACVPVVQKKLEDKMKKEKGSSPFTQSDVMNSIAELKQMDKLKLKDIGNKYNSKRGRLYGVKPKFIKMRIIHEILFYLIYDYDKSNRPLAKNEVEQLFKSYHIDLSKGDLQNLPTICCKEISWKMFIPPLPHHKGWPEGWALMCDVILRMPISVLCKLHACPYEVPELLEILNHPIKRFYLVKDLPESVRNVVLFKRKYLYSVHDSIIRLGYCGLIQFGPQKYKEKDQFFIYFNRHASLFDTVSSEAEYNKVTEKEYPKLSFFFQTQADIDSYWYNLYAISHSTPLNAKKEGVLVILADPSMKPGLVEAVKSRTPQQAKEADNGEIPGDRRGASGLDSSLWSHLLRNWFYASNKQNKVAATSAIGLREEKMEKILPQLMPFQNLNIHTRNKVYLHTDNKETKINKKTAKTSKVPTTPHIIQKKEKVLLRRIHSRKKAIKREYSDHLDKIILKKNGFKSRVKWSSNEDRALTLCKAADIFLNPQTNKYTVAFTVIRDIMHRLVPESKNKTSRACQRRIKLIQTTTQFHLAERVHNLLQIEPIKRCYSIFWNKLRTSSWEEPYKLKEAQITVAFVILMSYIGHHQEEVLSVLQGNLINIDHLSKENITYTEKNLIDYEESCSKFEDAKEETHIKIDVLKSIIHSSIASRNQSDGAFELFKIYQKYPDQLIRDAVEDLRRSQTISCSKFQMKKFKIWQNPFKLSQYYTFNHFTTFSVTTALETFKTISTLKDINKRALDFSQNAIISKKYGQLLGINEFMSIYDKLQFEFNFPQNIIVLNPEVEDHSELINELAERMQLKMKNMQQENNEADQDHETENGGFRACDSEIIEEVKRSNQTDQQFMDVYDSPNSPLDLAVDDNSETIDRLKTWVTDCMEAERERRSPSPEFIISDQVLDLQVTKIVPSEKRQSEDYPPGFDPAIEKNCDDEENINTSFARKFSSGQIPTVEEIKEEMLKHSATNDERTVPYITDLIDLLSKESYYETNTNELTLERLNKHFITQCPILENILVDELDQLQEYYMIEHLENQSRKKEVWNKVHNAVLFDDILSMPEVFNIVFREGGKQEDVDLVNEIVEFVLEKKGIGATGQQIKDQFLPSVRNCSLLTIIQILVDARIFLRAGICTTRFIHHKYQSSWLVQSINLSSEEPNIFVEEKQLPQRHSPAKNKSRIKVMPWTRLDGTINKEAFKLWLCNILSYCLDHPMMSFQKISEKFCFLKPVEIYYLLEVLQELCCLEVFVHENVEVTLFSEWEAPKQRYATFLDNFEDMFVTPNNLSMAYLGAFFYEDLPLKQFSEDF